MGRLLIWLSGARRQILDECPTERPKYVGIGASILITATMAAVSLAFALVTALRVELWLALPFAIAWGLAILSLDRLFVVSMSRDGEWPAQLLRAAPRVLLALLLGFVISTPFVLQIFRPEIEHEITILHTQAENAYLAGARNSPLQRQITQYQTQVNQLTVKEGGGGPPPQSPQLQSTLDQLHEAEATETGDYNQWKCQLYGPCQPAGNGLLAMADQQRYDNDAARVTQLTDTANAEQNQLDQNSASTQAKSKAEAEEQLPITQKDLRAAQNEQAQEESTFSTQNENNGGLLIRLQALDAVTSHDSTLNAARWLLFLLFVVIDCMPVMIKVMLNLGPKNNYDRLLEAEEQKQLRLAANNRELRLAAEMMAAGTVIGETQSRLAWSAPIPEVTQNIIATRRRVENKKLEAWEKAETQHLGGEDAAMPGPTIDVAPPVGFSAMPPTGGAAAPDTAQPVNPGNSDKSPQVERPGQKRWRQRISNGLDWFSKLAVPFLIFGATVWFTIWFTTLQSGLADQQHQGDIVETYLSDMRDLLFNQHLSTSKPGSEVRQAAAEETVTTLQRLDAQNNGTVLRFLRDTSLIGPQNEVIDLSNADLSNADLSNADLAGATLFSANLNHAHLSGAALTGASLSDAILTDADLSHARLGGAILSSANLTNADLEGADLEGADLAGAAIKQPQLNEVHSCTDAILPAGLKCSRTPIITLTYWYTETPKETPEIQKLIHQFEQQKQNHGIRIKAVSMNFYNTRAAFAAAVQDGNAPDVLRSDLGWTKLFASEGYLLNIDSYISQSNLNLSDYQHVPLEYDTYNGHLYGLPQVTDLLALLYNKAEIASPPRTMADFAAAAAGVVQEKKAKYGFETDGAFYNTLPFLYACGGGMLDRHNNIMVNNAGSVEGLQFLLNLESNTNHVMPPGEDVSKGTIDPVADFMKGQTAMIFDGPWDVSKILTGPRFKDNPGNLGIAGIPTGPAGQTGSPLGGQSYVVSSGTEYPAEAYKFIQFMSSEPSQIAIAEANHTLPTRQSAYRDGVSSYPFVSNFLDIKRKMPVVPRPTITQAAYMFDVADPSIRAALTDAQNANSANEALTAVANSWNQLGVGNEVTQSAFVPGTSQTACP